MSLKEKASVNLLNLKTLRRIINIEQAASKKKKVWQPTVLNVVKCTKMGTYTAALGMKNQMASQDPSALRVLKSIH